MENTNTDGYIEITEYDIHINEITRTHVIELISNGKSVIYVPIEMFAVRTFFRSVTMPNHPEHLVHDVILSIIRKHNAKVYKLFIYDLKDNLYLTKMLIRDANGEEYFMEINASDGFAVALKAPCRVYVAKEVIPLHAKNRIQWYETHAPNLCERLRDIDPDTLITYSVEDLSLFLSKTVEAEEYELSAIIQKILDAKKNPKKEKTKKD
ncbi:MAG: bifunctional nuclease family protein [Bacteroidales bacterium]|jgi:bifunctional DNase/RNase|nr:bifunctional nuclease family protein [Bacteroidales bacterium]